jgi:hypothetical protein
MKNERRGNEYEAKEKKMSEEEGKLNEKEKKRCVY